MRTSELPRLTRLSERRKGYLLVLAAAFRRSKWVMLLQRRFAVAEPARRVLPDLLAAAREQERANIQLPKTKRAGTRTPTTQRRTKADHQPVSSSVPPMEAEQKARPNEVPTGHAEAAIALSRRNSGRSKLPRGQRWKERRLPQVCWARKLPRT